VKFSARELVLLLATVGALLFGVTALVFRPKWQEWQDLGKERGNLRQLIQFDRALIDQRGKWDGEMAELSRMLSRQPAGQKTDVHFLSIMDRLASKNGLTILRRQVGEEKPQGEVYELPIECRDWEGSLDALVHFLFDLQSEGAMFDVRQLMVRPREGPGLRGRFMLYCAYPRGPAESGAGN
jgi:hypothetical protein